MLVDLVLKLFYKDFVQEMSIEQSARPLTELRIAAAAAALKRPKPPAVLSRSLVRALFCRPDPTKAGAAAPRFCLYCSAAGSHCKLLSHFAVCWKAEALLLLSAKHYCTERANKDLLSRQSRKIPPPYYWPWRPAVRLAVQNAKKRLTTQLRVSTRILSR